MAAVGGAIGRTTAGSPSGTIGTGLGGAGCGAICARTGGAGGVCRVPLTYTPMFWSLVFPLGMYALASLRLSLAVDFPPLRTISLAMAWLALGAWVTTAAGLVVTSWRSFREVA